MLNEKTLADFGRILVTHEYIQKTGYLQSILLQKVINTQGNYIPWYTYPAIDLLEDRVTDDLTVFEYGSGYGTLWWAKHVKRTTVVEHNLEWFKKMLLLFPDNVRPIYRELKYGGNYCRTVKDLLPLKFDIIIIDGRDRVNCCKYCLDSLTSRGVIIFDNTHINDYTSGVSFIKEHGFRELRLYGLTPMTVIDNATSFFYRNDNCLGI